MYNSDQEQTLRVALYLRVSTDEQVEKYGLDFQKKALYGLIASKGNLLTGQPALKLAGKEHIYIDEGISGTDPLSERPAFSRLQENIELFSPEQRPFDAVAVYKIDRFARKLKILLEVIDLFEDNEIKFISATESIDTSTSFGKAMLSIIGVIAELEIETIKERTKGGREEAYLKKGVIGHIPYGYKKNKDKQAVIFEEEAEVIRLTYKMFLDEGKSYYEIAKFLSDNKYLSPNASAVKNKKSKKKLSKKSDLYYWRGEQVKRYLTDEFYIGKYYFNKHKDGRVLPKADWKLSEHKHPPIIKKEVFDRVQEIINKTYTRKPTNVSKDHIYLLSGLLRCNTCYDPNIDESMVSWHGTRKEIEKGSNNFSFGYICRRKNKSKSQIVCNTLPLPADEVEEYVANHVKETIKDPQTVFNYQKNLKSTKKEIKLLENQRKRFSKLLDDLPVRIEKYKEMYIEGLINKEKRDEGITKENKSKLDLTNKLKEIDNRLKTISGDAGFIESFIEFSEKYKEALDDIYSDRQELSVFLSKIVEEIVVFSRPVTDDDIIAGRRKEGQMIPNRIEIKLRLPQELMTSNSKEFVVNSHNW